MIRLRTLSRLRTAFETTVQHRRPPGPARAVSRPDVRPRRSLRLTSRTGAPSMWMMSTIIRKVKSMAMRNPPHPGGIVRGQCLEPLNLSVTHAAKALGVMRQTLSYLVNERAGVSVEMAIRLSKAFGSSPKHGSECKWPITSGRFASARLRFACVHSRPRDEGIGTGQDRRRYPMRRILSQNGAPASGGDYLALD